MRNKILQALREAGHGLIPDYVRGIINTGGHSYVDIYQFNDFLVQMEIDKLIILHRSSGSAGIPKGEIVLITLRPDEH